METFVQSMKPRMVAGVAPAASPSTGASEPAAGPLGSSSASGIRSKSRGGRTELTQLSDAALLASVRATVGRANQLTASLLAHLAEVHRRGLHRERACSSLYSYCIYELRMSEDAAQRRSQAARWVRRFPALLDAIEAGELHLTGLLQLAPHLTDENLTEVLALAKHRSKREIAKLVRQIDPLPDVPARIEPLGPRLGPTSGAGATSTPMQAPSWQQMIAATVPVRHLRSGDRPRDWLPSHGASTQTNADTHPASTATSANAPPRDWLPSHGASTQTNADPGDTHRAANDASASPATNAIDVANDATASPATTASQRYHVQFTVGEEYLSLLQEAQNLLGPAAPDRSIDAVHLRALRLLVQQLTKRKRGATRGDQMAADPRQRGPREARSAPVATQSTPRQRGSVETQSNPRQRGPRETKSAPAAAQSNPRQRGSGETQSTPRQRGSVETQSNPRQRGPRETKSAPAAAQSNPRQRGSGETESAPREAQRAPREAQRASREAQRAPREAQRAPRQPGSRATQNNPRQRVQPGAPKPPAHTRYIPVHVRAAVWERDGGRCAFVDDRGQRCREQGGLELHHRVPFARGGPATLENLSLRCRAHNALAAEHDFGPEHMARTHEPRLRPT